MADELGMDRRQMVLIFTKLYLVANLYKCFAELTKMDKLDYSLDVAKLLC